ncbi:MAG: phenylalanine 4-monooxygenase [Saprospiraceae bacterium]|nr:phenylalanine 4-monooxygenase [Saprospiraceae bacterium]
MRQVYENYTAEDFKVWSLLFDEQAQVLPPRATVAYLKGIKTMNFNTKEIPNFIHINQQLEELTGWKVYVVPGIIDNKPFFEHLYRKEFPATTWLRRLDQLKYIEEPDMFHDVFGHVPLLSEPFFCEFLSGLSYIALDYIDNEKVIEWMTRIYWYTVEFGLIRENGQIKIYGAGILSSPGESIYCLSEEANHLEFNIDTILDTPYIKDQFQGQYFIIESYKQLSDSLTQLRQSIEQRLKNMKIPVASVLR